MADLSRGGFDHLTDNDGADSGFIEFLKFAVASPDIGTAGIISRVSASYYRRLFAAALLVIV